MTKKQVVLKQLQATPMIATVELFKPVGVHQDSCQRAGRRGALLNQALRRQKQELKPDWSIKQVPDLYQLYSERDSVSIIQNQ